MNASTHAIVRLLDDSHAVLIGNLVLLNKQTKQFFFLITTKHDPLSHALTHSEIERMRDRDSTGLEPKNIFIGDFWTNSFSMSFIRKVIV